MSWNKNTVKPYKGHLVQLDYGQHQQTGIIRSTNATLIVFDVNKESYEVPIRYENINQIKKIKSKRRY
jgi:hypothetical protein